MKFDKYLELNKKGLADFHAHTCYCDGDNTPEEMVRSAAEKGLAAFGLSGHGYTTYDESYCMLPEDEARISCTFLSVSNGSFCTGGV